MNENQGSGRNQERGMKYNARMTKEGGRKEPMNENKEGINETRKGSRRRNEGMPRNQEPDHRGMYERRSRKKG